MIARVRDITRSVPLLLALCAMPSHGALAQGAAFLLAPFGARSVGRGEAVVADSTLGTEGIWYNAAALARMPAREIAFHNGTTLFGNIFMLSGVVPSRVLGTLGGGAYMFDYGDQPNTDDVGNTVGNITNRNYLVAATYASPIGKRFSTGLTYKFVSFSQQCSGLCPKFRSVQGSTNALDAGVQYTLPTTQPITIGATVRNIGQRLQFKDREQADPLPRTIQIGAMTRIPVSSLNQAGATLDVSADISQVSNIDASFQALGAALGYREQIFLTAGYKHISGGGGGPSIGFSLQRGAFGLDLSRRFDQLSSQVGQSPPTYVALRARF